VGLNPNLSEGLGRFPQKRRSRKKRVEYHKKGTLHDSKRDHPSAQEKKEENIAERGRYQIKYERESFGQRYRFSCYEISELSSEEIADYLSYEGKDG